ncbi:MAG: GNAT family N-acetyltransferase [Deltaproteobacteria bacterium]|uniref:GNAT family N-acetyltransferase n=1 Tax=Candidatus Zymogenus saltonus TaxID=2844893 RepID=A0A9D8KHF9_9DELT|nr:GNAT family N-acetyltransferase [Candidatus Zymogenus saltonus]
MKAQSVTIRPYKTGDARAVIGIMREVFIDEYGWTTAFLREAVRTLRKMLMTMIPVSELFLVCESREGLCGVMFLKVGEEDSAFIRWLAVKRGYRGRGIGRILLEAALEFSREAGYESVKLITVGQLHEAMELYRCAGFIEVGQKETVLWDMEMNVHYMEIRL